MRWIYLTLAAAGLAALLISGTMRASGQTHEPDHGGHQAHHGDPQVLKGLVIATARATTQRPRAVRAQVQAGSSISEIAQAHGAAAEDVLHEFDALIDQLMGRAVGRGRFPESVGAARAAWYKQSARLQLDQPGLTPAFPGLHEMHVLTISAAVQVGGLPRGSIRRELRTCATLSHIVAAHGVGDEALVREGLLLIEQHLQPSIIAGRLSEERHAAWRAALEATVRTMVTTPGLHVAGKECAR